MTNRKLAVLLLSLVLGGCAVEKSAPMPIEVPSTPAQASSEIPWYYEDFDPTTVGSVINPCEILTTEFFKDQGLDLKRTSYNVSPSGRIISCQYAFTGQTHNHREWGESYIFKADLAKPEVLRSKVTVFREEGPWLIAAENLFTQHGSCTASISTNRGRFGVARTRLNKDPEEQQFLCREAKEMAVKAGDFIFGAPPE